MTDRNSQYAPPRGDALGRGVMLLIGLLAGVALAAAAGVFLLGIGWALPEQARVILHPSASATPAASASATPATTSGTVPEPCVRSAQANLEIDRGIDDLSRGTQAQDAKAIQEALDRLQDARDRARGAADECLAAGR